MDTLIFGLLLYTAWTVVRGGSRVKVLLAFAAGVVAVLLLFNHHVTDKLPLNF